MLGIVRDRSPRPDLGVFLESQVYPALFERLDEAFPDFHWQRRTTGWVARSWPETFPAEANDQRPDRL